MTNTKNPVIMTQNDYNLLQQISASIPMSTGELSLAAELERSIIVTEQAFPSHAIRLNSRVAVLDLETQDIIEFTIVTPELADTRHSRLSVTTPMGTALIGYRKEEEVHYHVPNGFKSFRIVEVANS